MVIELLAGKMRLDRGRIAAVEDDMRQTYTVKHIRKGLTLLSSVYRTVVTVKPTTHIAICDVARRYGEYDTYCNM